ncbi:MAG: histidine kinase dimerization/phospho-acceptor domain-containing protein, partial [Gammaproteobacteria bacterium]
MKNVRFTIRLKLLVLSLAVLSIPYLGYEYLRELDRYLRTGLESSLMDAARAVAGPLHEQYTLFPYTQNTAENSLFIQKLQTPIQLDGYTDDWLDYLGWSKVYQNENTKGEKSKLSYKLILGQTGNNLKILLQVQDPSVTYQKPDSETILNSDHVELVIADEYSVKRRYYFTTSAPGRFNPFQIDTMIDEWYERREHVRYVTNIIAEWQQTELGYNLEISLPLYLLNERLGFIVRSIEVSENGMVESSVGSAGSGTSTMPGRLIKPSGEIEKVIARLDDREGRRLWVLDSAAQVLSSQGNLQKDFSDQPLNIFYSFILPVNPKNFKDDLAGASRLQGDEVKMALQGSVTSRWRASPDGKAIIVSAAAPIWIDDEVRGAAVVEETTNSILMLQRNALVSLFNKTLLVFFVITLTLLIYATRLSVRLRRLSLDASEAIDEHGRVIGKITGSSASDEIGDLSRSYASMLDRLKEYNSYLESLAGKLSHELRTPMAVVQSSLDNLQSECSSKDAEYLERAQDGIKRLNMLVLRLSEAARLEQALQTAEVEFVDLTHLLNRCGEGYKLAYPEFDFNVVTPSIKIEKNISTDLFTQMLDKLVGNAIDFSSPGKPIKIILEKNKLTVISIINYGSVLPLEMKAQLFNSMVSFRAKKDEQPHLGLGLHIAK